MTLYHYAAIAASLLPVIAGVKQPDDFQMTPVTARVVQTSAAAIAPAPAGAVAESAEDNAMANTYGFLRKSSNTVGSAVESTLGIEGSLDDMNKNLDEEYKRWILKKKVLMGERDQLKSEIARAKGILLEQKAMREEKERLEGRTKIQKGQNKKREDSIKADAMKWKFEKSTWEDEIKVVQCNTANIERVKQERVEAANKKTSILKDANRLLQRNVFDLNKEVNKLTVNFSEMKIQNNQTVSQELGKIEVVQKKIHALEEDLLAQAQLEEAVQRARERVAAQASETVKQRAKITEAQGKCLTTKKTLETDIEASKHTFNNMNDQMMQCQELDGENQRLQAALNQCILKKRSIR
jgi:hypothetical protein